MAQNAQPETVPATQSPFRFRLSDDGLRGFMDIDPGNPESLPISMEDMTRVWAAGGFVPDFLNLDRVLEATDAWNKDHAPRKDVPVAEARLPVAGRNARLETLVDTPVETKPVADGNGRIDLRKVRAIRAVEKGQALVRRHPPTPGIPGANLLGKNLPAVDGTDILLPIGEQVAPSPSDPDLLLASISGFVEWDKDKVHVRERFIVNGDIDYSTGNVDYDRSVYIKGDVQDGFSVRCGGNLEVDGSLSDARVTSLGKAEIHGGFVGTGLGKLATQGAVQVGFVSNQTIRAYGALTVAKESFNARLFSRDAVFVLGPLVGGFTQAGLRMEIKVLGNSSGTRTEVELGGDYLDLEHKAELEKKIKILLEASQGLRLRIARIKEGFLKTRRLNAAEARLLFQLQDKVAAIDKVLPGMETRKTAAVDRLHKGYARKGIELKVEGRIYPGVIIKVDNQSLRITEEVAGPRLFSFFDNRIHMY